ncbi:MAG TPA: 4,5-DOPA dioxygenase extradiol, partial [Thermoanaerobaculia bacterium]|nr:4,5-DOPA dioxygenase extradiol [Thermoanaerobaculia bacterium]
EAWRAIGASMPKPRAIVCVSAHWYLPATLVTAMERPRTIHDFGGFPRALYEVEYPAKGDPDLFMRIRTLFAPVDVEADTQWGLDHGTWSVLVHLFPNADIPVVQLSIDETQPAQFHYDLGRKLAPLRDEGVLVMGSGNLVHNLHTYAWGKHDPEPFDWAVRFEALARDQIQRNEHQPLIDYENLGHDAQRSAPTPDHYLPLLYILGTQSEDDAVSFPVEGVDGGSVSMLTVKLGPARPAASVAQGSGTIGAR